MEVSMRVIPALVMAWALILGGWPQTALADPFKLNSGKIVDILAVDTVKTAQGTVLKLQFRSKTPLSDTVTLRIEANGLWEHFLVNAERGGHKKAVISAMGPKKAGAGKPVDFIFVKRAGDWRTLAKGLGPDKKLTEKYLRQLASSNKRLEDHGNHNAALLYLARDWTVTYVYPNHFGIEPITLDRDTFFELRGRLKGKIKNKSIKIEFLGIHVSDNGMAAQMEMKAMGQTAIRGRLVSYVGRYISNIELRQGAIVSTQAQIVFEKMAENMEH
jgi:hypothetical protein